MSNPGRRSIVDVEWIREYVGDSDPENNYAAGGDYRFSEAEIHSAMRLAASAINSLKPKFVIRVQYLSMPQDPLFYTRYVAHFLYRAKVHKLSGDVVNFTAGSTHTDVFQTRYNLYTSLMNDELAQAREEAQAYIREINRNRGYSWR